MTLQDNKLQIPIKISALSRDLAWESADKNFSALYLLISADNINQHRLQS